MKQVVILAIILLSAGAAYAQHVVQNTLPTAAMETPEQFRPLLGKWELSDVNASLEVLSVTDGKPTLKYVGRSGREIPMDGVVSLIDGKLHLEFGGGQLSRIEYKLHHVSGKGAGALRGTLRSQGNEREVMFLPRK
jgi:hypothetical protein